MPFFEALKLAISAILNHKLRSFLTLLGVIFGVATVIVVVSLIEGFNAYVDEKIADIGTNAFAVQKYSLEDFASIEALNSARRRNKDVTLEDVEAHRERGGTIQDVGAKADGLGEIKFGSTSLFRVHIKATTPNIADIERIEAQSGRYFNKGEDDSRRPVCFIGADVADKLFPTGTIQIAAIGVTSISLVVGGIVIMNIMLVSVSERTKEIGIRKSIGARRSDIVKQFLAESTMLSLCGGAIGISIAYLLAKLVAVLTPVPTALPWVAVSFALAVSASVGLVSGVYPAWRAARLDPIEALRSE